ncbi:MAG: PhnE/PtxC family ABC transporter permease [Halocynthiibacter sp.]
MNDALADRLGKPWRKPPLIKRDWLRWVLALGALIYLVLAINSVEVNWMRVYQGLERGAKFVKAFTSPDFISRSTDIWEGMIESVTMTVTSSVVGIIISIPIGLGTARNISPLPVYLVCRAILGLVGAGGIGATLNTAFDRYEYDTAAAILIIIIVTVMIMEYLSGIIRARVQ